MGPLLHSSKPQGSVRLNLWIVLLWRIPLHLHVSASKLTNPSTHSILLTKFPLPCQVTPANPQCISAEKLHPSAHRPYTPPILPNNHQHTTLPLSTCSPSRRPHRGAQNISINRCRSISLYGFVIKPSIPVRVALSIAVSVTSADTARMVGGGSKPPISGD